MDEQTLRTDLLMPRLAELEAENERLRQMLAELLLTNQMLRQGRGSAERETKSLLRA
ncbi:hypothetical protein [Terriglobus albidus]|uniref:hypothetical protein n=1 Tax=Terriglobus albidus TaxID=1592106 RepID=UPI0021E0ED60|nr:hypothetical protein [Terriglobus albidus]